MGFPVDSFGGAKGAANAFWNFLGRVCGLSWEHLRRVRIPRRGPDPRLVRLLTFRICEAVGGVILILFLFDLVGALAGSPGDPFRGVHESTRNLARCASLIYIVAIAWLLLLKKNRLSVPDYGTFHVPAPYQILMLLLPLVIAESGAFHTEPLHLVCEILPAVISLYIGGQLLFIDRRPSENEIFTGSSGLNHSKSLMGEAIVKGTARLHALVALTRKLPYLLEYFASAFEGRSLRTEFLRLRPNVQRQLLAALRHASLVSANAIEVDLHSVTAGEQAARLLMVTACSNVHLVTRRHVGFVDNADPTRIRLTVGARDGLLMSFEFQQKEGKR